MRPHYGTMAIGTCQKAAFRPVASVTLTCQSYRPGGRSRSGMLMRTGIARDVRAIGPVTAIGCVSTAFHRADRLQGLFAIVGPAGV